MTAARGANVSGVSRKAMVEAEEVFLEIDSILEQTPRATHVW
jgi:hypothetical protein